MWFANIFSLSGFCPFTLLILSFNVQKFLILMKSNLSIYSLDACAFGVISKNSLPNPTSWSYSTLFSSKNLIVVAFMFKSLIHFELIFVCGVLKILVYGVYGCISVEFHSFAYGYPVFSALLFEENGRDLHAKIIWPLI